MALATQEIQVTWAAADSVSLGSLGTQTSDTVTPTSNTVFQLKVMLKADNSGTPTTAHTVDFYLLESLGDPDGAGADEFATGKHGRHLALLDTSVNDPAIAVVWIPGPFKSFQIHAVNNGTQAITISATVLEQTG